VRDATVRFWDNDSVLEMTERLYYSDSYLREFSARITDSGEDGRVAYLDRTAFYPTSGGQPFDTGSIAGVPVLEVVDEDDRIAHRLAAPVAAGEVHCAVDWQRRFDHMQQHSGQHLLSAAFEEQFRLRTVSFHLGAESATIDLEGGPVDNAVVRQAERRANELIWENRPLTVVFEDADQAQGLRKASERAGTLRVVTIEGLDRSACGGTHVRATGEIGAILIRKLEKVRQAMRVEFLCGGRAVSRARADFDALTNIAQQFSAPLHETPALVAAQLESARAAGKERRKLELELAAYRGKDLYQSATPGSDGMRRHSERLATGSMEDLRAIAQSFTAQPRALFAAAIENPPSILLAASEDSGVDAGKILKALLTEAGGRGGGATRMAQGSVPNPALLGALVEKLLAIP